MDLSVLIAIYFVRKIHLELPYFNAATHNNFPVTFLPRRLPSPPLALPAFSSFRPHSLSTTGWRLFLPGLLLLFLRRRFPLFYRRRRLGVVSRHFRRHFSSSSSSSSTRRLRVAVGNLRLGVAHAFRRRQNDAHRRRPQ